MARLVCAAPILVKVKRGETSVAFFYDIVRETQGDEAVSLGWIHAERSEAECKGLGSIQSHFAL